MGGASGHGRVRCSAAFGSARRNNAFRSGESFAEKIRRRLPLAKSSYDLAQAARFEAGVLYEKFYCARGDMENRIKEQQLDLFADRTSTHWMASNQLRLWFSAFAHLLMSTLQAEVLRGTELAEASIGQIRLRLFKIAARFKLSVRRIHIELCSAYPLKGLFAQIHHKVMRWQPTG